MARAENGIVELIVKFSLRIRHFDDNAQICFQGDNLAAEMTFTSNVDKEYFPIGCCQ